jgi:UDPglucose 6-dehydrogenase
MADRAMLDVPPAARKRNVAVIGSGYVGLTLSAALARLGHWVECTDQSYERVAQLAAGQVPIFEDGLTELVGEMLAVGRLCFTTDNAFAAARAEIVFLCLPTPSSADGRADLSFIATVATEIGPKLRPGAIVVTKSTVPVGTSEMVASALGRDDVSVASNPEFLAEGSAVYDCLFPDRIIVGADTSAVAQDIADLYGPACASRCILMDVVSAELTKYASNAYLATRLTFVNSIAELCEAAGADIRSVIAGMGSDHRIGSAFLQPGPGWGGSCFPKDTHALVRTAELFGCELALIRTAISENARHTQRIVDKLGTVLGNVSQMRIAMWGLTFKAETGDLRNSPALAIAHRLTELGASVHAYDPTVPEGDFRGIKVHATALAACKDAEALVIGTEWPEFASVDLNAVATVVRGRTLLDARNLINPAAAIRAGFIHVGIGLPHQVEHAEEVAA